VEVLADRAKSLFKIRVPRYEDALRTLLDQPDNWLAACALHEIGQRRIRELADKCRALAATGDPLRQETAIWALAQLS
jgi:hypothetical protein